jgi:hypothetical protein
MLEKVSLATGTVSAWAAAEKESRTAAMRQERTAGESFIPPNLSERALRRYSTFG